MRKVLKWIGIGLGVVIGLVITAAVILYFMGGAQLNKTRQVQPPALTIPANDPSLVRGEHLVNAACKSCHGSDLSGTAILADPAVGTVYAANISGLGERRTDQELVLAIRHGIGQDGRQLIIMPAESFINFSGDDLGAVIAYLKTVPRVGLDAPEPELTVMGQIMLAVGMFGQIFPAEYIDHDQPLPAMPAISANPQISLRAADWETGLKLVSSRPCVPVSTRTATTWTLNICPGNLSVNSRTKSCKPSGCICNRCPRLR